MKSAKKICSLLLSIVFIFCALPIPRANAADEQETFTYVEDYGNGIQAETTVTIYPPTARNNSTSAASSSNFTNNGKWIATVTLKAYFTYNGMTAGVTGTEYAKLLASGWSYTNHKITTTTLSTSDGGTAVLTAILKDPPINIPIRLGLHCAPDGTITRA